MRAVILAGECGTDGCPIALEKTGIWKNFLGRPLPEHVISTLRGQGFTDLYVTLSSGAEALEERLGDGSGLGVRLTWMREERPLGTAGSVKRCLSALDGEDLLVVRGDCIFDLDLRQAAALHRSRRAEATLVLCAGGAGGRTVLLGPEGRVEGFSETVPCGPADTGICVLSPSALDGVEEGAAADFGKHVFPRLLAEGRRLCGCLPPGRWRDMSSPEGYLAGVQDGLEGRIAVDMGLPERGKGLFSAAPIPEGVEICPPCWVGRDVELSAPCRIGPCTVLSDRTSVGAGAVLSRTVLLEGAAVGQGSTLRGAILRPNAAVRRRVILHEGVVLGENALAEDGAELLERVKLWPGQTAPAGVRLDRSITCGSQKGLLSADDGGVFRGVIGEDMGPEALAELGGVLGVEGAVGLGCSDTPGARMLARAAAAGITAAGGDALTHPLGCPAQGAWLAGRLDLPVSLFVEEERERIYLHLFDGLGLPPEPARVRKLEQALKQGEQRRVRGSRVGVLRPLDWDEGRWAEETARRGSLRRSGRPLRRVIAAVEPDSPENMALRGALAALGCGLEDRWRAGIPAFRAVHGGFYLTARDERGTTADPGQMITLVTLIEMENGGGRVAVPAGASAAVELVAAGFDGTVLRLERDGRAARVLYAGLPWLREGLSAAVRICARMASSGETLSGLLAKTPRFHGWQREVPLRAGRDRILEELAGTCGGVSEHGLRLHTGSGWVALTPLLRRPALRVLAEGPDLELAAELCDFYAGRAAALDRMLEEKREKTPGES